jgi:hypothetical protein
MKILMLISLSALLFGCSTNCRETERMGDFEFSQGNHARATKLYDEAWEADSTACPEAGAKAENARLMLRP